MKKLQLFAALIVLGLNTVSAQSPELRKKEYNVGKSGLAIEGYDPVAYFTDHKAVEGKENISTSYKGITYRFSTAQHRDLFNSQPAKYEPQYGGWCAYAMGASGDKVEVDPETFKILDGRLYLFYNKFFNNTLKSWNKTEPQLKNKGDQNWSKYYKP